jgi:hypothetical protein
LTPVGLRIEKYFVHVEPPLVDRNRAALPFPQPLENAVMTISPFLTATLGSPSFQVSVAFRFEFVFDTIVSTTR